MAMSDDEVAKFFCSANADQTQFMVCIVTKRKLTTDDILIALESFIFDCGESELDLLGPNPFCSGSDH